MVGTEIAAGLTAIVTVGTLRALHGSISPGDLVVFIAYLRAAYRPLQRASKSVQRSAKALAAAERVVEVLEAEPLVALVVDEVHLVVPGEELLAVEEEAMERQEDSAHGEGADGRAGPLRRPRRHRRDRLCRRRIDQRAGSAGYYVRALDNYSRDLANVRE